MKYRPKSNETPPGILIFKRILGFAASLGSETMELLHIHYHARGKQHKYLLLLYLGQRPGKTCGVVTEGVSESEKNTILKNKETLSEMSLDKCIEWLKAYSPTAYQGHYREIHNHNITIVNRYKI